MKIVVLHTGVDTLEASVFGSIVEGLDGELDLCKTKAQVTDTPESFPISGEPFFVHAKGQGDYAWVLSDHRMLLRVSRSMRPELPVCSVKLRASALASDGHRALWDQALAAVRQLGAVERVSLSRIDLALDVQGFDFTDADFSRMVCPARYRGIHKDGDGVTYRLGKGDVVMRIYRKDAELRANKKQSYSKLWERNAEYDPDKPVWRIEVQLRGQVLNELNARDVGTTFGKLERLFRFGMVWGELRVPYADTNKSRWPVDPAWESLSNAWGECRPEPRIRHAARAESEERVISRFLGASASLGAYSGKTSLVGVLEYAMFRMEQRMADKGVTFAELVEVKTARIGAEEQVGRP